MSESPPVYLLTRFAQLYKPEAAPPPSEEWLARRLELLNSYTLPSVKRQTDRDFHWLLLVSDGISQSWQDRIQTAVEPYGTLVIQQGFTSEGDSFSTFFRGFDHSVITVWLDSDDMLHPNYISAIKAENLRVGEVLSFVKGAVFEPVTFRSAVFKNAGNPFVALHDFPERNIFQIGGHTNIRTDGTKLVRAIHTREPMWLQVIHGGNLANWFKNYARPVRSSYLSRVFHAPVLDGKTPARQKLRDVFVYLRTISVRVISGYVRRIRRKLFGANQAV